MNIAPELSLVVGIDGSGKSTFLQMLETNMGAVIMEPTSSPEARAFKASNLETPVDTTFINERERIYLNLNQEFDTRLEDAIESGQRVATTGSRLVTLLSHELMRTVITDKPRTSLPDLIGTWAGDASLKPEALAFVHAPAEVIRARITARQMAGDTSEFFWGFNAPHFLWRYQDAWHEAVDTITKESDINCLKLDSSKLTPNEMLDLYQDSV
ncbi:hypothetical protein BH09PAT3_BH09PAT3_5840 [soil metagenome]